MNPPEWFIGIGDGNTNNRPSPRKEVQLQGPRPAALKVNKDSYKIKKPPVAPPQQQQQQQQSQPSTDDNNQHKPVIIYAVSPKVIHTTVTDFMNLVQRLTGNASSVGDVSPAARLASIEKEAAAATTSSPRNNTDNRGETATTTTAVGGDNNVSNDVDEDLMGKLHQESEVELGRAAPGILSPAPGSLPPISPGFFSPAAVDPFMMGNSYFGNMFALSPSTLFSSPMVSPSPSSSSLDLFNPFFDF